VREVVAFDFTIIAALLLSHTTMLLFALSQSLKSFADVLRWQHRDVMTLMITALLGIAAVALQLAIVLLDVLAGVRSVSKSEAVGFVARQTRQSTSSNASTDFRHAKATVGAGRADSSEGSGAEGGCAPLVSTLVPTTSLFFYI
jgi:hypothetical protein